MASGVEAKVKNTGVTTHARLLDKKYLCFSSEMTKNDILITYFPDTCGVVFMYMYINKTGTLKISD